MFLLQSNTTLNALPSPSYCAGTLLHHFLVPFIELLWIRKCASPHISPAYANNSTCRSAGRHQASTPCLKNPLNFANNYGKHRPIFKLLSPTDSQGISRRNYFGVFHLVLTMLLNDVYKISSTIWQLKNFETRSTFPSFLNRVQTVAVAAGYQ